MTNIPPNSLPPPARVPPLQIPYAAPNVSTAVPSLDIVPADWTNVEIFSLDPARLGRFLVTVVSIQILMSAAIWGVMCLFILLRSSGTWADAVGSMICLFTAFFIYTTIMVIHNLVRTRQNWKVCRLILADQGLLLTERKGSPKRLNRSDVTHIVDTFDTYRLHLAYGRIDVSKRFLGADRIRERLASWMPIGEGKGKLGASAFTAFIVLNSIVFAVLFWLGCDTSNRTTLAVCAVGTLVLSVPQIMIIYRNRASARSLRIIVLFCLVGPLILFLRLLQLR